MEPPVMADDSVWFSRKPDESSTRRMHTGYP